MTRVVILGGGFAGVFAAKEVLKKTSRSQVHVTLIDKNSGERSKISQRTKRVKEK